MSFLNFKDIVYKMNNNHSHLEEELEILKISLS
jgi:hypothetical protein